ncbi:MAG: helix-turn-helix domain-containing protein [bacterium]
MNINTKEVKKILLEKGITLNNFAKSINVTPATLSEVINNKRKARQETIEKITEGLAIEIKQLFSDSINQSSMDNNLYEENLRLKEEIIELKKHRSTLIDIITELRS